MPSLHNYFIVIPSEARGLQLVRRLHNWQIPRSPSPCAEALQAARNNKITYFETNPAGFPKLVIVSGELIEPLVVFTT